MLLYKYYPPNINSFKSIVNSGLWCDKYLNMNDPFESLAIIPRSYSSIQIEEFKNLASNHIDPTFNELAGLSDEIICEYLNGTRMGLLEHYYFSSLSETYDNILLWSHYALSHTGFVLALNLDQNKSDLQKVRYQDELPRFDISWHFNIKNEETYDSKELSYLLKDFAIKSSHWSYENEWRVCLAIKDYYRYLPEQIQGVYLGAHCDSEIEMIILMLLSIRSEEIPVYKMVLETNPLRMGIKEYELKNK